MGWGTLRKAWPEDHEALNAAAKKFAERHELKPAICEGWQYHDSMFDEIQYLIESAHEHERGLRLRRQWYAIMRRVLDAPSAEGIAYGYVGYHAE